MNPIGVAWPLKAFIGWGQLGINIAIELHRSKMMMPVLLVDPPQSQDPLLTSFFAKIVEQGASYRKSSDIDFPVLFSVGTDFLENPLGRSLSGKVNIAIIVIEHSKISSQGQERAKRFRVFAAASDWIAKTLSEHGIRDVFTWHQGVDLSRFHPAPRRKLFPDRFVIFSGGALQIRKGQDTVVAAFRAFRERHSDALLITAWGNPYPQIARTLSFSKLLKERSDPSGAAGVAELNNWLHRAGLPAGSFINLPLYPNSAAPDIVRQADVALFPNRAEGATNLIAMEAMACGIPCIMTTNAGHRDLVERIPCFPLGYIPFVAPEGMPPLGYDGWCEPSVEEIVARLDEVYFNRGGAEEVGLRAASLIEDWSWERQVPRLMNQLSGYIA
jgi:glycosyltransferase involved in cell wall biosynthesis